MGTPNNLQLTFKLEKEQLDWRKILWHRNRQLILCGMILPVDVSTEVNFIWSIANKLRGTYQSDKYKDVIIPMVIIRRFECALEPTKDKVVAQFKANPSYPAKAMYRISGFQFYNTSEFTLAELINDSDHLAGKLQSLSAELFSKCTGNHCICRKGSGFL